MDPAKPLGEAETEIGQGRVTQPAGAGVTITGDGQVTRPVGSGGDSGTPARLGSYVIERELGRGGMADRNSKPPILRPASRAPSMLRYLEEEKSRER